MNAGGSPTGSYLGDTWSGDPCQQDFALQESSSI